MAQLLKEPDTKTSLADPAHLKTVGLACAGSLLSQSRSCCQARNSCMSGEAWARKTSTVQGWHQSEATSLTPNTSCLNSWEHSGSESLDIYLKLLILMQLMSSRGKLIQQANNPTESPDHLISRRFCRVAKSEPKFV